jgi:hypothetical protein
MSQESSRPNDFAQSLCRRELLRRSGMGLGLIGLAGVLADDKLLGMNTSAIAGSPGFRGSLAPRAPHFAGKARQVVHLF